MSHKNIQDILPLVEQPSRYIGSEINTSKKDLSRLKMKKALAFPDLYEIGTSHFGIQILYHMINQLPEAAAERVFAPAGDVATRLRKDGLLQPAKILFLQRAQLLLRHIEMLAVLVINQVPRRLLEESLVNPFRVFGRQHPGDVRKTVLSKCFTHFLGVDCLAETKRHDQSSRSSIAMIVQTPKVKKYSALGQCSSDRH